MPELKVPPSRKSLAAKKTTKKKVGGKKKKEAVDPEGQLAALGEADGEIDFETLVHNEYMRLHRQYRVMEDTRRRIAEKSKGVSLQGRRLELLNAEKTDIATDLMNADSLTWHEADKISIATILNILEFFEKTQNDILFLLKNCREMEDNVDKITKRLVDQKLKVQAIFGVSLTVPQADRRKSKLEDRLYHHTTRFDTKVSLNKAIRDEVNMMLKLRSLFYERLISMKNQLGGARSRMAEIVYLSTSAYDSRDDFVFKINMLREKNDKECRQHVLEMKEFTRILHHDAKLHDFMGLKNKERELMENFFQRCERKNHAKLREMDLTLHNYNQSLRQILKMSGYDNMHRLVANYNAQEQENFSMFKCSTDLNHEVTALKESYIAMQRDIDQMYLDLKKEERAWKEDLEHLEDEYQLVNTILSQIITLWENAELQMNQILGQLNAVFSCAECENSAVIRLLGHSTGISPTNAVLCLGVLENRVSQLMHEKNTLDVRRVVELEGTSVTALKHKAVVTAGQKMKTSGGPFSPQVIVTGRLDGDEDEDGDDEKVFYKRPMSYADLKAKLLDRMINAAASREEADMETVDPSEASAGSSLASIFHHDI